MDLRPIEPSANLICFVKKAFIMKNNVGIIDRVLRIVLGIVIGVLIYLGTLSGTAAIVLGIVGGIFVLTALTGSCGLYSVFGFSTCPVKKK